jgi:hypothetical protein
MKYLTAETPAICRPFMFLHGVTGGGKSTWATCGGKPLVLLTEPKAASVLRQLNPAAVGMVPESLDDLDKILEILGNPEKTAQFDRIVLDSFTELTLAIPRWLKERAGQGSQVLLKLELSQYGDLRDYALAVVKAAQLTGLPGVVIGRSVSKRSGLVERIQPDGMGRSVEELPGKLLPTAEARFDAELGYVVDTTPAEHSQRCGLPWVPAVWQGPCLDYLRLIEAGPEGKLELPPVDAPAPPAPPAPAPEPAAPAVDQVWLDLLASWATSTAKTPEAERKADLARWEARYAEDPEAAKSELRQSLTAPDPRVPDPEKDPEGYKKVAGTILEERTEEKAPAQVSQAASDFVDAISPERAKPEDARELLDLCAEHKVRTTAMWAYALSKEGAAKPTKDGAADWTSLSVKFCAAVVAQLKDPQKRAAFIPWLHQRFQQ